MQSTASTAQGPDLAPALEASLRAHVFRALLACTLSIHALLHWLTGGRLPVLSGTVFALALAIGAWVELAPRRAGAAPFVPHHLTGVRLLGTLYTGFIGVLVATTGAGADGAPTWWLPVYPLCVILAGAVRHGLTLLGAALLWFVGVRLSMAMGWWVPTMAPNGHPVASLLAMLASFTLVGGLLALSVQRRQAVLAAQQSAAEQLAREHEQARARTNATNLLLVNTTHELRTPLNSIIGLTDLLTTSRASPAQERELLNLMRQSTHMLRSLADDVLDYAKLEAGRLTIERIEFPLRTTVFAIVELFAPQAHAKGLELGVCFDPELPHRVLGDPLRVRQILANLISNAIKFTAQGGVQVCGRIAGPDRVRLEVHDSGTGIDAQALAQIFQPFVQVGDTTARVHGGSGLGLSICSRLAQRMGGRVGARSTPGEGSVFWAELPLQTIPAASPYDYPALPPMGSLWLVSGNRFLHWTVSDMLQVRLSRVEQAQQIDDPRLLTLPPRSVVLVDAQVLSDEAAARAFDALARRLRSLGTLPILLCSTITSAAPASITGDLVSVYKPLRLSKLLAALLQALAPVAAAPAPATPDASAPVLPLAGVHVLLADDNPVNRLVATGLLEHLGARVVTADDGPQTLQALQAEAFDIVLLDCEMPGLDGPETAARWRAIEAQTGRDRMPILAVTGHSRDEAWSRCEAAGMDGFLAKPYFSEQLQEAIRAALAPVATR